MTLVELGTYLIAQGIGTVMGTDVFAGKLPPTPDVVVCLFEYASLPAEPAVGVDGTTVRYEYPRVQVVTRGVRDDYSGSNATAKKVRKALMKIQNQNLTAPGGISTYWIAAIPESGPFFLRRDNNDRVEFVVNCQAFKAVSSDEG